MVNAHTSASENPFPCPATQSASLPARPPRVSRHAEEKRLTYWKGGSQPLSPEPPTSFPRGDPLGGRSRGPGPILARGPSRPLGIRAARSALPARGPMCSASARALPAGAPGWRAARDVTAARARAARGGGGRGGARSPARRVRPGPGAPGSAGAPPLQPGPVPPAPPLRALPERRRPPSGVQAGPPRAQRARSDSGRGSRGSRRPRGRASPRPTPGGNAGWRVPDAFRSPAPRAPPHPRRPAGSEGVAPLARWGRRVQWLLRGEPSARRTPGLAASLVTHAPARAPPPAPAGLGRGAQALPHLLLSPKG